MIPPWLRNLFRLPVLGYYLVRIYFLRRKLARLDAENAELKRQVEVKR